MIEQEAKDGGVGSGLFGYRLRGFWDRFGFRFDFLSPDFRIIANINWIPQKEDPGFISFMFCVGKAIVFSYAVVLLPYFLVYYRYEKFDFDNTEIAFFSLVFVFFEEHARWTFLGSSLKKVKSAALFFIYMVLVESTMFFVVSDAAFLDFLVIRSGSVFVHAACGFLSLRYMNKVPAARYSAFIAAIAFHVLVNLYLHRAFMEWLER